MSGGTCSGTCPVYELYLFDDGRLVFNGRKDTSKVGVWKKQLGPEIYTELLTTIVKTQVLEKEVKRKTCLKGRSMLIVMRSASQAGDARTVTLNSGCEGHTDLVKRIEGQFIDSTGVAKWLISAEIELGGGSRRRPLQHCPLTQHLSAGTASQGSPRSTRTARRSPSPHFPPPSSSGLRTPRTCHSCSPWHTK